RSLLVFFRLSGPHPYLHSFPTRRSSDLMIEAAFIVNTGELRGAPVVPYGTDANYYVRHLTANNLNQLISQQNNYLGSNITRWKRSEEHTSELQSRENLVCRLLLEKKKE